MSCRRPSSTPTSPLSLPSSYATVTPTRHVPQAGLRTERRLPHASAAPRRLSAHGGNYRAQQLWRRVIPANAVRQPACGGNLLNLPTTGEKSFAALHEPRHRPGAHRRQHRRMEAGSERRVQHPQPGAQLRPRPPAPVGGVLRAQPAGFFMHQIFDLVVGCISSQFPAPGKVRSAFRRSPCRSGRRSPPRPACRTRAHRAAKPADGLYRERRAA